MTSFDLSGKVALVTGASGKLGSAIAKALGLAGATVLLTARDETRLAATGVDVPGFRRSLPIDLTDDDAVDHLFEWVRDEEGLDILINNAGVASSAAPGEITGAELERVYRLNVVVPYLCAQASAPLMKTRGGGKIVNVGSIYGSVAPDRRLYEGVEMVAASAPYVASKSALVNVTRELAVLFARDNIQVNQVSPGGVFNSQPSAFVEQYEARTPAGRMAEPDDIAWPVVFLSSVAAGYVTGQNLVVDGGFTAW